MRITCPNCQAQYNIDPGMIPEAGRDVQCSSCAHTWFQTSADDAGSAPQAVPEKASGPGPTDRSALPEEAEAEAAETDADDEAETWDDIPTDLEMTEGEELATDLPADDTVETAAHESVEEADHAAPEPEGTEVESGDGPEAEPEDDEVPAVGSAESSEPVDTPDTDDRIKAAIDRSREDAPVADAPDSEDYRTAMRDAVTEPATSGEPEGNTPPDAGAGAEPETAGETGSPLDSEVEDILREEAEFEVTRRRGTEAPPVFEPQGDLGLDEGRPSAQLRERLDRMRGDGVPETSIASAMAAAGVPLAEAPRRERLPDIEQINSSLRPGDRAANDAVPISPAELAATRRAGFRTGFTAIMVAAAVAIAAYVYAPQIVRAVPASEPAMIAYVAAANAARDRIDGLMARAISELNDAVADPPGDA